MISLKHYNLSQNPDKHMHMYIHTFNTHTTGNEIDKYTLKVHPHHDHTKYYYNNSQMQQEAR